MAKMGNEENPLDRQCEMLENEFMGLIHRAYEEYDFKSRLDEMKEELNG